MIVNTELSLKDLYEKDFVLWVDQTVQQLQERDIAHLDWEHLIEEIDSLGNEQRRKVSSYLKQILIHLLLYQYWLSEKERCAKGWENEIESFRDQLDDLLESKTLYNHCLQEKERIYRKARLRSIQKTKLNAERFPEECPFTLDQILDFDFLPSD
jgi:hypothetical protein